MWRPERTVRCTADRRHRPRGSRTRARRAGVSGTSRSRRRAAGPSGDSMAAQRPRTTSPWCPDRRCSTSSSWSQGRVHLGATRSSASNATRSRTPCSKVPTSVPPGMAASPSAPCEIASSSPPSGPGPPLERTPGGAGVSSSSVSPPRPRLTGDGRLLVHRVGDRRVRGASPVHVEVAVEDGDVQLGGCSLGRAATGVAAARRPARPRPPDPRSVKAVTTAASGALLPACRDLAIGPAGRRGGVPAPSSWCLSLRPTTAPPGAGPVSGRRRAAAGSHLLLASWSSCVRESGCRRIRRDGALIPVVGIVEHRDVDREGPAVPGVRDEHDRELQPLAPVHRDDLYRLASDSSRRVRSSFSPSRSAS